MHLYDKVPSNIRAAPKQVLSTDTVGECPKVWELFMKFAVTHQSHRPSLMPPEITALQAWNSEEMIILRKAAKPLPAVFHVAKPRYP